MQATMLRAATVMAAVLGQTAAFSLTARAPGLSSLSTSCMSRRSVGRDSRTLGRLGSFGATLAAPARMASSSSLSMSAGFLEGQSAKDIDGNNVDLGATYAETPAVLVVNLASKCGLTDSNYGELVELAGKYSTEDLVVLGFPCNQFGAQEPGTEAEVKAFVQSKYGAKFPLFSKVDVNGPNAHPLYQKLKKEAQNKTLLSLLGDDIKWNFGKFLISNGNVVKRYEPTTKPLSIVNDIDSAIQKAKIINGGK
uniref:Glutathione peroxidase n=1 Tax=Hanusia phi TaxID=3032 RepID=A0A7S0DVH3_9CRYP|mmetsp:Transcript_11131/g.25225  ORF Transcript_11131/g.25225 Transcript_11131/m.25225 type:complete len:252 (+) Transcript_11131:21-776(+)